MSSTLSLFPSRIKIANQDGTMTPEFYRALQALFNRVGGTLGDVGVDTFGSAVMGGSDSIGSSYADIFASMQASQNDNAEMLMQTASFDMVLPDIYQPNIPTPKASGGAAPAGGVGTAAGGYDTAVNRDAAITLLNNIRLALINAGIMT